MAGLFEQLKQYLKDAAPGGVLNPEATPQSALDTAAMSTMAVPIVGDIAGLGADAYRMYNNPKERTLGNAALMGLGALPFVPNMAMAGLIGKRFKTPDSITNVPGFGQAGEITDQYSRINQEKLNAGLDYFRKTPTRLGDILEHPSLYRDYPELRNLEVAPLGLFQRDLKGAYGESKLFLPRNAAKAEDFKDVHSTVLHEVQHAIQELDKMPRGGMTQEFLSNTFSKAHNKVATLREAYIDALVKQIDDPEITKGAVVFRTKKYEEAISKNKTLEKLDQQFKKSMELKKKLDDKQSNAFKQYKSLAGEAQARAVQSRFMHPEEYKKDVLSSYDVPIDSLIYKDPFDSTIK